MPFEINSQGGANALPPIPKMDAPPAARDAAIAAREAARAASPAVREAVTGATGAAPQAPTPAANPQSDNPVVGTTTTAPELPFDPDNIIPEQAVEITQMFFITCVIIIIGWPLARAFARFIDRRTEMPRMSGPDITPQIRQLQESVDTMAIELERISESQRFQAKLMAALPEPARLPDASGRAE